MIRLKSLLKEEEVVKNKETGNVYVVQKMNPNRHVKPSPAEIEKAKAKNLIVLDSNMPFSVKAALGDPDAPCSFYNRCIRYFK